jgi:hypothetical protein
MELAVKTLAGKAAGKITVDDAIFGIDEIRDDILQRTVRWQLMVLQACTPLDAMQSIPGIRPGARILLHAEGEQKVRSVLAQIDTIEALHIEPADVSPTYWRTLGNRLAARLPLPDYSAERHTAWLAGRALR